MIQHAPPFRSRLLGIAALALAACQPTDVQPPEQAAEEPAEAAREGEQSGLQTLAGEWRVAGIDGEPLDEPYGLALSADDEEIWWEPRCAGAIRSYVIVGHAITFGPRTSIPPEASSTPAPVCALSLPPRLVDVMQALAAAERIERTPSNGLEISGGERSVTLYSQ